jgi:tetratricopeptide (TPR) repeat protein
VAQYGVLAVTLAAPIAIGGGRPWVQVALAAATVLAGLAWRLSRRRDLRLPPFSGVAALGLLATLLQLLPLPAGLVNAISPRAFELRADALVVRPAWLPLTLDVPATALAAGRGLTCLLVLVLAASATRRGKSYFLIVPLVATSALIAALSFFQRAVGAETILGFYRVTDLPGSGFFGTFIAANHAASFFTLGALLGLGCARETDGNLRTLFAAASFLCLAGLLSTGSRFGFIGAAAGGFAMLALWLLRRLGTTRGLLAAGIASLVVVPLAVTLALGQRGQWGTRAVDSLNDFKVRGWSDAAQLALRFPLAGVGRGAFEAPATAFRAHTESVRLMFPENLLLQLLTEWGAPITIALIALFMWTAWPILRRLARWEPIYQAAACAVIATLVHDLADFGLEVLGVAMPTAMVLGVCAGRRQLSLDASASGDKSATVGTDTADTTPVSSASRLRGFLPSASTWSTMGLVVAIAGSFAIVAGSAWAASRTSDEDAKRIRTAITQNDPNTDVMIADAIARHPADHDFALLSARWAMRVNPPSSKALRQLNRAQRLYPAAYAPHVFTAHLLVGLGRPSQAAIELRMANELGANLTYAQIERLVGARELERAIPREPEQLFKLAFYLVSAHRIEQARAATTRAIFFADNSEHSLARQMEIALASQDKTFIAAAAAALGRVATSTESFELAIRGLGLTKQLDAARALIRKAAIALPHEGTLTIKGARVLLENGDAAGARALVAESATRSLVFTDRIAGEELLAEIADKEGDVHGAAAARARARILGHMRNETSHDTPAGGAP